MKRQKAAGKPFFLYLPFSMGHIPDLPSKQFAGKSRIGQYGDKLMEGDYHVGQILDTLKEIGVDDNTLLVFASDNGPSGEAFREYGNQGTPDMGSSGPFRGELGEATDSSIRTFCFVRWPGKIKPGTSSNAMFSIMDFMPTFARILGAKMPTDRPIDGVDQTDVLLGKKRDRESRQPAELHRCRSGGSAVEAMARVFHRRATHRHRAPAPARRLFVQRAHRAGYPQGFQHRDGPARRSGCWRGLRVGRRPPARRSEESASEWVRIIRTLLRPTSRSSEAEGEITIRRSRPDDAATLNGGGEKKGGGGGGGGGGGTRPSVEKLKVKGKRHIQEHRRSLAVVRLLLRKGETTMTPHSSGNLSTAALATAPTVATQVPIPQRAADVPGPVPGNKMRDACMFSLSAKWRISGGIRW